MLFLGIISWKGASRFNGWRGLFFSWGGFIFKWGVSHGGIGFDGLGSFEKNRWMGGDTFYYRTSQVAASELNTFR